MSTRERLYQIKVLNFAKSKNEYKSPFIIFDEQGRVPAGNMVDRMPDVPSRTLLKRFKDNKAALRYGNRFGTVISCHKVDTDPYLKNIEFLNLKQEPIEIEVDREEYVLNKDLELKRPRRKSGGRQVRIEIVDNEG